MNNVATRRIAEKFAQLSAEQRRAVYGRLRSEGMSIGQFPILARHEALATLCALSYAQTRQWFLWQLDPASTAYHIAGALTLKGALAVDAVEASFAALVARHEALRTVFRANGDGLAEQLILPEVAFEVAFCDLSGGDAAGRAARVREQARRINETPFDLARGPLLRVGLIRAAADEHVLVVVMHHIVSDGWSMQIIVDEFAALYRARVDGQDAALAALPVQYADYAVWQRSWLEAGEKDRQLAYWTAQLGDEHTALQLPADHPRRADASYRAAWHGVDLPAQLVEGLHRRAQAQGATLFMVLLAAFQALLKRYSGQEDIRVGVPIANRHRVETEAVLGFFVNTQVLRNRMHGRMSLAQVLTQARDAALGAQEHQDLPFEQLVEALQPERSLSSNPLFQVMFNHQRTDYRALERLPGLERQDYELGDKQAQFELTLDTSEDADGKVRATFSYAEGLFDAASIERMAAHYIAMLQALAERPAQLLGEVELLNDAQQRQLKSWGDNERRYPDAEPVQRLFERQAALHPETQALVFGDVALSYAELNARANRLAHHLIGLGVRPETRVGIAIERSVDMVVGLLGILKAGGAYVPLDPDYPAERLRYMVEDSGIALLLTHSGLAASVPHPAAGRVLLLDRLDLAGASAANPAVPVHGENLAYVIYTSGSTGMPKGAANRHRSLSSCMIWMQETYQLTAADTVLHKAPFGFDVSVWELFWPLTAGVRLALAKPGDQRDPARLVALIQQHQVTTVNFVPAMLQAFLAHEGIEASTRLKHIICGGEAMPAETQKETFERLRHAGLHNLYGPTEAAIHVTHWACRNDGRSQVPIGRPISDTRAYVLDCELNLAPAGVAGELYLGGVGLGRGYLKRAGLTAERFVADPFDPRGGRLYRTGDLVRWNGEGQLEYLGRIDHQIKIRGFRIELGEIEAQLLAQPAVREAVVVAKEGPGGSRLVAYLSEQAGHSADAVALRERLHQVLPDYMVPSAIVVLERLPLNANGKVDRKALPEPEFANSNTYEAPQGEREEALAALWSEVLGVERVGRDDNFFELGGHSLLALRLLERMRGQGRPVQVRTLFQHPRLAAFAQAVTQERGPREVLVPPNGIPDACEAILPAMLTLVELDAGQIGAIEAAVPGGAANIQDIYPLAPLQEGILFHHLLQTEGDTYITPQLLSFDSAERLQRFIASFNQVIARHDILRTAVLWEGLKEPLQVVWRKAELQLRWLDQDTGANASEQLAAAVHPSHYRIDVRQAPMIRALAAHDSAQGRWLLQLSSHHLVLDHATLELLAAEIALVQQGRQDELLPAVPFRRFVAQARLGVSQAEHETFFRHMLGDVDEPTAPFNLLDVQGNGTAVEEARLALAPALSSQLRRQAQRYGVSAATLFHLAWALVLAKTSGKGDVVFGTVLFGRMQGGEDASRALGLFINTLPLRIRLGSQDVEQCLRQTHAALTGLLHHEHASLSLAQRCSALPGGTPLFSALLNYRYVPKAAEGAAAIWEGMDILGSEERTNYPLTLSVDDLGEDFALVAQVTKSIGARRLCGYMHEAVSGVVAALADRPRQLVCELGIMAEAERQQLRQASMNPQHYPDALPVHSLIERQAARTPDATALLFGDAEIAYAELNRRANRLAHRLIGMGVKPETKVGIAIERSVEMVVGLLGILKAGGAYVPLDPDYPAGRLRYMVEDSGIALLLTQSHLCGLFADQAQLTVLALDTLDVGAEPAHDPQLALHGENLAYVIYTSGSTGKPKGAANRHRSLHNRLAWMQQAYLLTEADTVLQKTPFSFDVSVWEFFWPLMVGARLAIAAPGDHRDPARLVELIRRHRVSTLHFVPSMLQAFLAYDGVDACTSLARIVCSGEALPAEAQNAVFQRLPRAALYNLYGPTEAAIDVTHWTCRNDGRSQVPIGRPISDTRTYVLDADLNLAPAGVAGELYLGGVGLARGYLDRAGLTAERFVADPFDPHGGRLYRTGDLVRWNDEGQLDYLGRIDHQVKIRGFRIELGEVEAQLLAQPDVCEAVVVAKDGAGGTRLVAYIALQTGRQIELAVLRERLGVALPDYMVPSAIVVLERLPLNANGKVDRKALPEPEFANSNTYEAPQGELEEALAALWSEVLGVERVGRDDNFFELGGHSLLALRLLERMRGQGRPVQVRTLFQHPRLAAFAQAVTQERGPREVLVPPNGIPDACEAILPAMLTLVELDAGQIGAIEATVPGGAANIQDIYPLAPLQEGILFHHVLQTEGDAYVTPQLLSFDSAERLQRFIASFNQVIARHDILRTAVLWEGLKEPLQVVWRKAELQLRWLDQDTGTNAAELLAAAVHPSHYRIDVRRAPMIRALAAHDREQGRWLLQLPSHHLVLDHTTLELLVEEIALIQQGRQDELLPTVPFRRFVAQARLGVSQAEHETFFRHMLGDVDEPTAPFNLLDVQGNGTAVEEARLALAPALSSQLRRQAQRYGVSAATLFHLAWALVLAKTSGKGDVVFGTVLFGRMQGGEDASRALGLFINTLPLRIRLGSQDVEQCLRQTHAALTGLLHHEHASLSLAQRCSALPGGTPLFSALLNYRYVPQAPEGAASAWEGMQVLGGEERSNYPLALSVDDLGEGFALVAQVRKSIGAQRLCGFVREAVGAVVAALADRPRQLVCELEVMSEQEAQQLGQWGDNKRRYPDAETVQRLFERQVALHPETQALAFGDVALSYAELNARANRLAHHLIGLGVRPETRVGIAIERSVDMVVGLLGILKAGGAYVPLDPDYPAERLRYMVEDSGIALLLTHSGLAASVPHPADGRVLLLDRLDLAGASAANPAVPVHGENLAYVIYTSGSTGMPKGAANRHRSLSSCMTWMQETYQLTAADTVLHKAPFGFDVSVWELFWPLTAGVRLALAKPGDQRDPARLVALIQQHQVTTVNFVPAMLQAFLAHEGIEASTRLKHIICGGEAMPAETQKETFERLRHAGLHNLYGPTEAAIHVTHWACRNDGRSQVPIGRPISDTRAYVLDGELNLAPAGVAGELYLGGVGLGRGYLKRAGLTAERFVADPFDPRGGRLYRTGDLVRWNGEGQLEYLGRIDHQIKIRGFRIELGEIEAQLLAQPAVREAVVVAKEGPGGSRLVAYLSEQAGHSADAGALRERLHQVLPDYMVPSAIVVLERLPLNANGKVDRKALPEPDLSRDQAYEAPQGELEHALADIWAGVLGVERVGRNDNFFELGGHSLLVLRAVQSMRRLDGMRLGIKELFASPTIAQLASQKAAASTSIRLNAGVKGEPALFLIHDGWGSILDYTAIAKTLAGRCTVIGLPLAADGLAGMDGQRSLLDIAKRYVAVIMEVQPQGPYRVAGWSLGGAIATMIAGLLEQQGETVQFVGAIDPYVQGAAPGAERGLSERLLDFLSILVPANMHAALLADGALRAQVQCVDEHRESIKGIIELVLAQLEREQLGEYGALTSGELAELFLRARELDAAAKVVCAPPPTLATVHAWWSTERPSADQQRFLRWFNSSHMTHRWIDADHLRIVREPVVLGELSEWLFGAGEETIAAP
ncbi:non-ribosomal peptide synthetase [Janthinobacterium fluminis]|uniref:Amino acid adenylation domain-containing protein n=1 Tax=Janthinobacterium fluminis TaxID=2987524 RepID=A0ABT5K466_9BURK|nr:non-ribosomal peptide synthetase [Janthinobacterium fluminis]MDC8759689.1 amino acid adenylation domain-containing protein [Janthinobacterium fluminis]